MIIRKARRTVVSGRAFSVTRSLFGGRVQGDPGGGSMSLFSKLIQYTSYRHMVGGGAGRRSCTACRCCHYMAAQGVGGSTYAGRAVHVSGLRRAILLAVRGVVSATISVDGVLSVVGGDRVHRARSGSLGRAVRVRLDRHRGAISVVTSLCPS